MRICVLQPSYRDSESAIKGLDPPRDLTEWLPGHEVEHAFLDRATGLARLGELDAEVFVNLCDGAEGDDTPGIEIVHALERRNAAFTGAGSAFYDPTRAQMKEACRARGVPTPHHAFADDERGVAGALSRLRLPCFVKPRHGFGSVGVSLESCVTTEAELRAQAARMIASFGGALIEEFIAGREFSVLVASDPGGGAEPVVYPAVECGFAPGVPFKTFDAKWRSAQNPWIACADPDLDQALGEMTRAVFLELGGVGYARSDVRRDAEGRLFFLELNPNCAAFYPDHDGGTADVILALAGGRKVEFLAGLIAFAQRRQREAAGAR